MSLYVSPADFTAFHDAAGEVCDQAAMKAEMVAALTNGISGAAGASGGEVSGGFSLDLSWLDWPDIDLSDLFDFIDLS